MTTAHDVLEHPVWSALTGPHADLAEAHGAARRYRDGVSALVAVDPASGGDGWRDLRILQQSAERTIVFGPSSFAAHPPPGWQVALEFDGLQMLAGDVAVTSTAEIVPLGAGDLAEMLELVARTEPGPFGPGALRMGRFLGVRHDGRLAAMAGERLRLPGWVEISAVCTDPSVRGRGLGGALVGAVVQAVRDRGDEAFLHVAGRNTGAVRLYERLGFTVRRPMWFAGLVRLSQ